MAIEITATDKQNKRENLKKKGFLIVFSFVFVFFFFLFVRNIIYMIREKRIINQSLLPILPVLSTNETRRVRTFVVDYQSDIIQISVMSIIMTGRKEKRETTKQSKQWQREK